MIYIKRRRKRIKKWLSLIFIITAIMISWLILSAKILEPYKEKFIENKSMTIVERIINESIAEMMESGKYIYETFTKYNYSENHKMQSISLDTTQINKFKNDINNKIQIKLQDNSLVSDNIPFGYLSGISRLFGIGQKLPVKFQITGKFNLNFESTFDTAGSNMTVHNIRLIIESNIISTSSNVSRSFKFTNDFEVAQTAIIGDEIQHIIGGTTMF